MAEDDSNLDGDEIERAKTNQRALGTYKRRIPVEEADAESCSSDGGPSARDCDFKERQVRQPSIPAIKMRLLCPPSSSS